MVSCSQPWLKNFLFEGADPMYRTGVG